uniref:Zinc fingers and homeoboxes 2a n=1 Tax=Erpetoichthys calabaricus TaxID=27687 RepID=A0A8C4T2U8_ERPCA
MASKRKSTVPCMVRASELDEDNDPEEVKDTDDEVKENGSSHTLPDNSTWNSGNLDQNEEMNAMLEKISQDGQHQWKPQGGYECKYCPYSTQDLNKFTEHVDSSHPNVILNPLYVCAECNFSTKKYDTLSHHNFKSHPGVNNFKLKLIKNNIQTILEQTIEGSNSAINLSPATVITSDAPSSVPVNKTSTMKTGKPKMETNRIPRWADDLHIPRPLIIKDTFPAFTINGTVIIPEPTVQEGLSHVMPSLQRPPNYSLVPKVAVPLNTSKYNPLLDINTTLITAFNKFPYPTQAELSWLTAASKHPEEQIKVWFTAQRLKQGISWSPEEVEEARKKMFNGTIQPVQPAFAVLPNHLSSTTETPPSLIQTVPCQFLGQTSLVLTQMANGSTMTCSPITVTVANNMQATKRPLPTPVVDQQVKRANVIEVAHSQSSSLEFNGSHSFLERKKSKEQLSELRRSFTKQQFPEDMEVYRLIEATGLSRGEIKKWFSDQRYRTQKGVINLANDSLMKDVIHDLSKAQNPNIEMSLKNCKGSGPEPAKMVERTLHQTCFPSQVDTDHFLGDPRVPKTDAEDRLLDKQKVRTCVEEVLLNSVNADKEKALDQGAHNGILGHGGQTKASALSVIISTLSHVPISKASQELLKGVFVRTQWPSPEEYDQLALKTGLSRTDIVRWFKDNRSGLKSGTLDWMEQYQKMNGERKNGQSPTTDSAKTVTPILHQHCSKTLETREEDLNKVVDKPSEVTQQETCEL